MARLRHRPIPVESGEDERTRRRAFDQWAAGGEYDIRHALRLEGVRLAEWLAARETRYEACVWPE